MRRLRPLTQHEPQGREGGGTPPSRLLVVAAHVVAAAAVAAVAGCSRDAETDTVPTTTASAAPRAITVVPTGDVTLPWIDERRLHLGEGDAATLDAPVNATLTAALAPVAVPSRSGDAVAYTSWKRDRPVLRLRDLSTGDESILDEGAHSVALAGDGTLAYFKASTPRLGDPRRYVGHVVVRQSPRAESRQWTAAPGRYVVAAWADGRVLFYRLGATFPDLLALERPGRQRLLARASALVAVSPDGRRAFISRYGASPPVVRVVDVASGVEKARLEVDTAHVRYIVESGSWANDRVFAPATSGIAIFRIADEKIELEQVLRAGTRFPTGLSEARASEDGSTILAWGPHEAQPRQAVPQAELVECDRVTARCVRAAAGSSVAPPRPLYNPSRP